MEFFVYAIMGWTAINCVIMAITTIVWFSMKLYYYRKELNAKIKYRNFKFGSKHL